MANSAHPITIDGLSLDSLAWNVESRIRQWAGSRTGDIPVPGVDGELATVNDDLEANLFTLSMWVLGTDEFGMPVASRMDRCYQNLDLLSFYFRGKRHTLLDVREQVNADGTVRQFYGKIVDAVPPDWGRGRAAFTVSIKNPAGVRQDPAPADWSQTGVVANTVYEVITLRGGTAPCDDSTVVVTGPATNPQVTDTATGSYVRLNAALAAGETWRVNSATWSTRTGTLAVESADDAGTDRQSVTVYGGGNARFLRLSPFLTGGLIRTRLSLSGTGFTSATAVAVRARRKYVQ